MTNDKAALLKLLEEVGNAINQMPQGIERAYWEALHAVNDTPARFDRPTVEQVRAYCADKGYDVDPDRWFDYYSANGWKVGRVTMRDWQASVRLWAKNGYNGSINVVWRGKDGEVPKGPCKRHPQSGLTIYGTCFACYEECNASV